MKVAVIGSRTFSNYELLRKTLDEYYPEISLIVSGGARGADSMAEQYAKEEGIPVKIFLPEWDRLGRAAGMIRNRDIVEHSDLIVAFHDGMSKGTANSIQLAKNMDKKLRVVIF